MVYQANSPTLSRVKTPSMESLSSIFNFEVARHYRDRKATIRNQFVDDYFKSLVDFDSTIILMTAEKINR